MPTPTIAATGTGAVEPTPNQPARTGAADVDRLAADLKALRLQAQVTDAELAKLQTAVPNGSPVDALRASTPLEVSGLVGLALGLVAVMWWRWGRRGRRGRDAHTLADSSLFPDQAGQRPAGVRPGADPTSAAPVVPEPVILVPSAVAAPIRPMPRPVLEDSAFRPSSLDVTFVEHDTLDSSMTPLRSSMHDRLFAPRDMNVEFDPEVAASEVERVRKSLAAKRSERARGSPTDEQEGAPRQRDTPSEPAALLTSDVLFAAAVDQRGGDSPDLASVAPQAGAAAGEVDVLIDFPDRAMEAPLVEKAAEVAAEPEPEREIDVSVSLIQELRGLGLWSEARELAKEVVSSAHAPLDEHIASSLHQVQHGTPATGGDRRKRARD